MKATIIQLRGGLVALALLVAGANSAVFAQAKNSGVYVYPAKGQSQEQQEKDEYECYKWAKEESGVDPMNPANVSHESTTDVHRKKKVATNTVGGAAVGAGVGAVAGDVGKGAAIGAAAGATRGILRGRKAKKQAAKEADQQATQQEETMMANYRQAYSACMEGKGYTVR